METIRRKVSIPRTRELRMKLPPRVPVGDAEVVVVISPIRGPEAGEPTDLSRFSGVIRLTEDPLAYHDRVRSE